jgi:3-methyladenine DNA glycosylase AlkD
VPSEVTARARALVEERLPQARGLGQTLAELIDDPEAFVATLREGLGALADDAYAAEQERVAPGSGTVFGVRAPLIAAVIGQLRRALVESSSSSALWLADRLADEPEREFVFFSHAALRRSLADDPERSWQLIRQLGRRAADWISIDTLAEVVAEGILHEPFRWAELEQLVYSADKWERRLVGATIARLPFALPKHRREALTTTAGLTVIKSLIGDADVDVQKSLAWALRSWLEVDRAGVRELIRSEAATATESGDGHRAWVLRDALTAPSIEPHFAAEIRARLEGVRRQPGQGSTSAASQVAAGFAGLDKLTERALAMQGDRQGYGR